MRFMASRAVEHKSGSSVALLANTLQPTRPRQSSPQTTTAHILQSRLAFSASALIQGDHSTHPFAGPEMSHGDEHEYDHVEIDPDNPFRIDWTMNIDQVQNAYYAQLKEWEQSDCRAHLLDIVDRSAASRRWHFDKVVFFATGSFCQKSLEDRTRSMFQFICAVDLARELQKRGYSKSDKVEVFAQDPAHTEVDGELMHRLGVTKLEISRQDMQHDDLKNAKDHLGPHTVLLDFGMPIYAELCCAMFGLGVSFQVGNTPFALRHYPGEEGEALQMRRDLADRIERDYESEWFPKFEECPKAFIGDRIHFRKMEDSEET